MYTISGHHHISMLAKNGKRTNEFYETVLGMRRVKKTVNQDDPSMYHLFYGDRTGSPGTELTFFEMPYAGATHRGTNAITRIGLVVSSEESLSFWKQRFAKYEVPFIEGEYAKRRALLFEDEDGLQLALQVEPDARLEHWEAWADSEVPEAYQIKGMGTIEMQVRRLYKLERTLTELFGYNVERLSNTELLFRTGKGTIFGEILALEIEGPSERPGRGSIHHLAIRVKDEEELSYWDEQIRRRGFQTTGILERFYFKSLYFRESNGIMFELATDGPGFTIDSDVETLGQRLDLPPFLEDRRAEIEANLSPLD